MMAYVVYSIDQVTGTCNYCSLSTKLFTTFYKLSTDIFEVTVLLLKQQRQENITPMKMKFKAYFKYITREINLCSVVNYFPCLIIHSLDITGQFFLKFLPIIVNHFNVYWIVLNFISWEHLCVGSTITTGSYL